MWEIRGGSWSVVRQLLEPDPRKFIDYANNVELCRKEGLEKGQADLLSQYLHDLGVILHFQDDPVLRETVILKPEWGTNAVYAVLDTKKIQANRGRFSREDLGNMEPYNVSTIEARGTPSAHDEV